MGLDLINGKKDVFLVFSFFCLLINYFVLGAENMEELDLTELIFRGPYSRLKTKKRFICGFSRAKKLFNDYLRVSKENYLMNISGSRNL